MFKWQHFGRMIPRTEVNVVSQKSLTYLKHYDIFVSLWQLNHMVLKYEIYRWEHHATIKTSLDEGKRRPML